MLTRIRYKDKKKRPKARNISPDYRYTYWERYNTVCKAPDCKHRGKTPQEYTASRVMHNSKSYCSYCYHKIKYPLGKVYTKKEMVVG